MSSRATILSEVDDIGEPAFTSPLFRPGVIIHIVLFHFSEGVSAAEKDHVMGRFRDLAATATRGGRPYILSMVAGERLAGAPYSQGFVLAFASEGDRNFYVGKPIVNDPRYFDQAHDAFKSFVAPMLDDTVVFEFRPGDHPAVKVQQDPQSEKIVRRRVRGRPSTGTHLELFRSSRDGKEISLVCNCRIGRTHEYVKKSGGAPLLDEGDGRVNSTRDAPPADGD